MESRTSRTSEGPRIGPADQIPSEGFLIGIVLFVTAALFMTTLRFGFVLDDEERIVQGVWVHFWRFVPQYFQAQLWQQQLANAGGSYYRPFHLLWLRFNDALFGLHPVGWHAAAVGLHLLVTFLAYKVAREVTKRPLVAALAALIFAVHPMRHGVVAWVLGNGEVLWAAFFFGGLWTYLKSQGGHRARWMTVSCILYACGLFSKETAIVLPALVFAHAWIYGDREANQEQRNNWQRLSAALTLALVYIPLAIFYMAIRIHVLHGFAHGSGVMSAKTYVFTLPSVLLFYVKQWLLPIHMSAFYDVPTLGYFSVGYVVFPLLEIAAVAAVIWFFRRPLGVREVAFAAAFILIPLAPALDLFVLPQGDLVHDRYFYLPGFGAALLVALAFDRLASGKIVWRFPQRWLLATLALLALLCYDTANATRYWSNDKVLYTHAYGIAPRNFTLRTHYAHRLVQQGDYGHALLMLQQMLRERPNSYLVNLNLGRLLYLLHLYPASEHYLEYSRKLSPQLPGSYFDMALLDLQTNRLPQAEGNLKHAISLCPYEPMFHFALGTVLARQGDCSRARPQFATVLAYNPEFPKVREMMDGCRSDLGEGHGDPGGNSKGSLVPSAAARAQAKSHAANGSVAGN